jgi:hypothetical protein
MRNSLTADGNLPYGPSLPLSPQADLADLHSALRTEISPLIAEDVELRERSDFQALSLDEQIGEILS